MFLNFCSMKSVLLTKYDERASDVGRRALVSLCVLCIMLCAIIALLPLHFKPLENFPLLSINKIFDL